MKVVQYYIQVMEDGIDTRQLLNNYIKAKDLVKKLQHEIKVKWAQENKSLKKKLEETRDMLKKQQLEVVRPLFQEVRIKDEIISRIKS